VEVACVPHKYPIVEARPNPMKMVVNYWGVSGTAELHDLHIWLKSSHHIGQHVGEVIKAFHKVNCFAQCKLQAAVQTAVVTTHVQSCNQVYLQFL
jgi:hypothetical protein